MSRGRRNVHGHIGKDEFLLGLDVGNSVLFVVDVHGRITNNQRERAHIILSETDDRGRNPLVVVENIDWRVGAEGMEPGFIALRSRGQSRVHTAFRESLERCILIPLSFLRILYFVA